MKKITKRVVAIVSIISMILSSVPATFVSANTVNEVVAEDSLELSGELIASDVEATDEIIEKDVENGDKEVDKLTEECQKYVEDGSYEERKVFMQELIAQRQNVPTYKQNAISDEGKTAEQSQVFPFETVGLMPSTGEVKALVFMINFPDVEVTNPVSAEEKEALLFDLDDVNSFSGFYYTSSYGKLSIDGDVYGYYTTEHEQDYYTNNMEILMQEIFAHYDAEMECGEKVRHDL